jgi:hypothetical protein
MPLNGCVIVRPMVVTRFANAAPGFFVVMVGVIEFLAAVVPLAMALIIALLGVGLAVRGFRTGVRVGPESVTVYGYLWSRTIPRRAISGLTIFPAFRWSSRSGRARWTPMFMFMASGSSLRVFNAHHASCCEEIRRALRLPYDVGSDRRFRRGRGRARRR